MNAPVSVSRFGVIVDFDGVVARSTDIKYELLLESARHVGLADPDPLILALDSELNGADRGRVGHWVQERLARPGTAALFVQYFTAQFATRSHMVRPAAEFAAFLDAMRRNEVPICVVSLAPAHEITSWLQAVGDSADFAGIFGIECGPKRVTTSLAIDRLGLASTSVACIGDTPADQVAASQLGCRFIRMRSPMGERCAWDDPAVPTVASFADLPAVLESEFRIILQ